MIHLKILKGLKEKKTSKIEKKKIHYILKLIICKIFGVKTF